MSHSESITGPDGKEQEIEVQDEKMVEGLKKDKLYLSTKIEDLQAELDEKTERIMELEQVVRFNIQKDGFQTASKIATQPEGAWVATSNLQGFVRAITHVYMKSNPKKKVLFDIVEGELRNPRAEA